ncbi:MAG: hypothetical protein GY799_10485 [Desulfobulbaceae bacterium]|nr:hypothetical protein [Desulfobulbaceae bacterium]
MVRVTPHNQLAKSRKEGDAGNMIAPPNDEYTVEVYLSDTRYPHIGKVSFVDPQRAVQQTAKGHVVWVVNSENIAEKRPLRLQKKCLHPLRLQRNRRGPLWQKFFIDRPVFAMVISIIIVLGGLVYMKATPVALHTRSHQTSPEC